MDKKPLAGVVYDCSLGSVFERLLLLKRRRKNLKLAILLAEEKKINYCKKLAKRIKKELKIDTIVLFIPLYRKELFISGVVSNLRASGEVQKRFLKDYLKPEYLNYPWDFIFYLQNQPVGKSFL